ncbi:hypothetical protein CC2G_001701 [Coprinopsis cinerea AmutBmut pab1-1]|nr:hypothetical protein CC2G_001701 [Coprinopsis cinerea AmutBmut pab1-1]
MPTGYIIHLPDTPVSPQAKAFLARFAREELLHKPALQDLREQSIHIMHKRYFANYAGIYRRAPESWRTPGIVNFSTEKNFGFREIYAEWEELFLKMKRSLSTFESLVLPMMRDLVESLDIDHSMLDAFVAIRMEFHLPTRIPFGYSPEGEVTNRGYEFENRHVTGSDRRITGLIERQMRPHVFRESP